MGIESANRSGHGRTDQILGDVEFDKIIGVCFEDLLHNVSLDGGFTHDAFSTTLDPIHSRGFLVGAQISRNGEQFCIGESVLDAIESVCGSECDHIHAHCITGETLDAEKSSASSQRDFDLSKTSESGSGIEGAFDLSIVFLAFDPLFQLDSPLQGGQFENGTASHSVIEDSRDGTSRFCDGFATALCSGNESALSCGEGDVIGLAIEEQRTRDTDRDGHIADDILAALSEHIAIIIVFVRQLCECVLALNPRLDQLSSNGDSTEEFIASGM